LTFTWTIPANVPVSSKTDSKIKFLTPIVTQSDVIEFGLEISDGQLTQSKALQINITPYKPELGLAKIKIIEASNYNLSDYPQNVDDGEPFDKVVCKWR